MRGGSENIRKTRAPRSQEVEWEESSGNVFADFGVQNPELALLKSHIAIAIKKAIDSKGITQKEAGALMGIPAVKVSNIICGRLKGYTLDRLFTYLVRLDVDVQVRMKPKRRNQEHARIQGVSL